MTTPRLEWKGSDGRDQVFLLSSAEIVIGRKGDADLVVPHQHVSRRHAKLVAQSEGHQLVDLGSTYGTFVNGERVKRRLVGSGDTVAFGAVVPVIDGRAHSASVSPDGSTIACAYDSTDPMRTPLALIPANGGKMRTLPLSGSMYRWHPSGRAISFVREENGRMDLWLQPLDDGAPRRLTQFSEGSIVDYAWAPDGTRAVVAHVVDSRDVVLMR